MLKPLTALLALCFATTAWAAPPTPAAAVKPALTVSTVQASAQSWGVNLLASGNIAPWQEASIGAELGGLRLTEVRVNVGDAVRKGQVLAVFDSESIATELAQQKAVIAEAEAVLAEARANAKRSQSLNESGFISSAQLLQTQTAEKSAQARLLVATTALGSAQLRLKHTQVLATDSGVISQRLATVGAVSSPGQELFRLIRQGRLEWRAEVPSAELGKLKPGAVATILLPNQSKVSGKLRVIAPTVDMQTRNALVYVDLAADSEARAGMFARGEFQLASSSALSLPQSAVLSRDGFSFVMLVGAGSKVTLRKVQLGRRQGDRVEVLAGLTPQEVVVASGAAFLNDGDTVRISNLVGQ